MTVPGPFTMSQQAQDDFYGSRAELGHGLRGRRARGDHRPVRRRRGHRPARRAVHAGPPRARARVRPRRPEGRHRRHRRHAAPSTSASATRRSSTSARAATRSCPSWPPTEAARSPSRPPSPGSSSTCSTRCAGKTIILGVIDLSTDEVETPETVEARIRRAFPHTRDADRRAGLRHEVPAARRPRTASSRASSRARAAPPPKFRDPARLLAPRRQPPYGPAMPRIAAAVLVALALAAASAARRDLPRLRPHAARRRRPLPGQGRSRGHVTCREAKRAATRFCARACRSASPGPASAATAPSRGLLLARPRHGRARSTPG